MPPRNERFHTPIVRAKDGRSYCWLIIPAHEFALDSAATLVQLHANFAKTPKEKWAFDRLPLGLAHYDSVKLTLDLHLVEGTNLFTYLTDDGQAIEPYYNLYANTIWILLQGQGANAQSTDVHELTAIYIGVQVHYVGQEVKGSGTDTDLKCEIELVSIGKVLLEALPMKQWAASVKLRTELAGGVVHPFIPVEMREICYDMAYAEGGAAYAKAQRHITGEEEALFMPYLACFEELQRLLNATYRKLIRTTSGTFSLHGSTEGSVGTPYDYKNFFEQSTTATNALGPLIPREERLWLAYVRKKGTTEILGGLMWENDGLARQYSNALDFLQDATQEGACKGYFHTSGTFGSAINLRLSWLRVWHGENPTTASEAYIPIPKFGTSYSATRGANVVGGCQTSVMMPRGQNLKGYKHLVGGMSDNVRPYSVKCSLFTGPCINEGATKNGQPQYYFIAAPSNRFSRTGAAHEFNGEFNIVVAQGGFTVNRWFYAKSGFPGYNRPQSMICAAHHYTSYDLTQNGAGGLAGQYNDDLVMIQLPRWPASFNMNEGATYYHNVIVAALFGAMAEMQKQNDLVLLSRVIGRLFSNRSQTALKVDVARTFATPGIAPGQYAGRWLIRPSLFRAGLFPQLANDSVIIECESDFGTARDNLTFFTRSTTA